MTSASSANAVASKALCRLREASSSVDDDDALRELLAERRSRRLDDFASATKYPPTMTVGGFLSFDD